MIFGYKGPSDYWTHVYDLDANEIRFYQVVDGQKALFGSWSRSVASESWTRMTTDARRARHDWLPGMSFSEAWPSGKVGFYSNHANVRDSPVALLVGRQLGDRLPPGVLKLPTDQPAGTPMLGATQHREACCVRCRHAGMMNRVFFDNQAPTTRRGT